MSLSDTVPWNDRLRQERIQHSWRQRELAELLGTTAISITRWEQGTHRPSAYFRAKLCALFGKSALELGFTQDASSPAPHTANLQTATSTPTTLPSTNAHCLWNIPYPRNPFFTGREEILQLLHSQLNQKPTTTRTQSWALCGLGGTGKTQIALEYAYRQRHTYAFIFWSSAASRESLLGGMETIADLLQLPERNDQNQKNVVTAVQQWLATHQQWLWVLDNADDIATVQDVLSTELSGHLLLTSRAQALGALAQRIEVENMVQVEAVLFLLRRARFLAPEASLASVPAELRTTAEAIALQMDLLPLALDQAGAYIEEVGCSLASYLKVYRTHRKALLQRRGNLLTAHPEPVTTTWSLSLQKIEQANPAAVDFLRLCAFLDPDTIPEELISENRAQSGPILQQMATDPLQSHKVIEELRKFSLLQYTPEEKLLRMHRLVQAVIKDNLEPDEQHPWAERAVRVINAVFPETVETETWPLCQRFLSQAQICSGLIQDYQISFPEAASLLHRIATYIRMHTALYEQSELLYRQSIQIQEQVLEQEHPDKAYPLFGMANLYREEGKYVQAEQLFLQARQIWERSLPPEHPQMAFLFNSMAILYGQQGKYAEAEPLYQRALAIWEHTLGPDHLKTTSPLNNLALTYHEQGKFEQAEALYKRALSIRSKSLGPEHPLVASSLNNLAYLYHDQSKFIEAEHFYQRSLHIWELTRGMEHPSTTYPLNNLANLYRDQKKYELAEPLYKRALRIREHMLGMDHPLVASTSNGLANLYRKQRKFEQAKIMFERARRIRELTLGPQHPDVAETLQDLANLETDLGDYQEAISLYQRALAIREEVYGPENPKTNETREYLHTLSTMLKQAENKAGLPEATSP